MNIKVILPPPLRIVNFRENCKLLNIKYLKNKYNIYFITYDLVGYLYKTDQPEVRKLRAGLFCNEGCISTLSALFLREPALLLKSNADSQYSSA
jgi:hypothetical protein